MRNNYLFQYSYKNKQENKNHIIFSYDMNNLENRYKEKYGFKEKVNMDSFLDKFIDKREDLEKYKDSIRQIIIEEIIKENGLKNKLQKIDKSLFSNFRQFQKTCTFIIENKNYINILKLNPLICFYTYYLSIKDKNSYSMIKDNKNNENYNFDKDGYFKNNRKINKWRTRRIKFN